MKRFLMAGAAMLALACDNPVTPGESHEEPAGVAIWAGGAEIARVLDGAMSGALPTVAEGAQSAVLTVVFLDEHGDGLDLTGDDHVYLQVRVADESRAEFQGTGYTGRIVGKVAGQTTVQFVVMHGEPPGGHPDFVSAAFPLTITP